VYCIVILGVERTLFFRRLKQKLYFYGNNKESGVMKNMMNVLSISPSISIENVWEGV
jgi:hypothetical protein